LFDALLDLKKGERVAGLATLITLVMAIGKGAIGYLSGSIALVADAVHSASDVLTILASWFGLRIASRRPSDRFPYGYYKAESLATLFVSGLILYGGIELGLAGMRRLTTLPEIRVVHFALGISTLSALIAYFLARWERKVGDKINSQSLIANSQETQLHIFSSFLVFIAIGASYFHIPYIEAILTLGLAALILWVGLKNGRIAIYSLMDASMNPQMEKEINSLLLSVKEVKGVEMVKIRQAGPFFFGEASVQMKRSLDVARSHEISYQLMERVRVKFPQIEAFNISIEPYQSGEVRVMVPLEENKGLESKLSEHFGRAKFFALAGIKEGKVKEFSIRANPFKDRKLRAGLAVADHFLEKEEVDTLITKKIGEIGFYALRNRFIEVYQSEDEMLRDALNGFVTSSLKRLTTFTHRFDEEELPLKEKLKEALRGVIDPETGMDVVRMRLIKDLTVDQRMGLVRLTFRPASPVCPLAFKLGMEIKDKLKGINGVNRVVIDVEGFIQSEQLQHLLSSE